MKEKSSKKLLLPKLFLPISEVRLLKGSSLVLLNLPKVISFSHLKSLICIPRMCGIAQSLLLMHIT